MISNILEATRCAILGHWSYFYNGQNTGNDRRDSIICTVNYTLYPWEAFELSHCTVCNSEFSTKGIRAWPPIKRHFLKCHRCGGKVRTMNTEEVIKLFTMYPFRRI